MHLSRLSFACPTMHLLWWPLKEISAEDLSWVFEMRFGICWKLLYLLILRIWWPGRCGARRDLDPAPGNMRGVALVRVHPRDPPLHQDHPVAVELTVRAPVVDPVSRGVARVLDRDLEGLCLVLLEVLGDGQFIGSLFRDSLFLGIFQCQTCGRHHEGQCQAGSAGCF